MSRAFATPLPVYEGSMDSFIEMFNRTAAKSTGCFTLSTTPEYLDEIGGTELYSVDSSPKIKDTDITLALTKDKQIKSVFVSAANRADIDKAFRTVLIVAGSTDAEINEVIPSYGAEKTTVGVACAAKKRCFYVDTFLVEGSFLFIVTADSNFPVG